MEPVVVFSLPDGARVALGPGALIGRLETAALHLAEPDIAEAHAIVSLRGAQLRLLALRGRLEVEGIGVREVELRPGLRVKLGASITLGVARVAGIPPPLAVRAGDGRPIVLAGVVSLMPSGVAVGGYREDGVAWLWREGHTVTVREPGQERRWLAPGDGAVVAGHTISIATVGGDAGEAPAATDADPTEVAPLELIARFTSVQVNVRGQARIVICGLAARVLSELVAARVPMPWRVMAEEIWPDVKEPQLRARWDVTMSRLRKKLVAAGIRDDLVRADRHGNVELALEPGDLAHDEC